MTVRRRHLPGLVVLALAATTAALAGWAWHRRVELFQVPALWRTVRVLRADPSALPAVDERGLTSLDLALSRLIRLQRPGFLGGKEFRLVPLRGRGVGRAVVAIYYPLDEDFEAPIGDEERPETVYFCGCDFLTALALDASGRVLGEPLGIEVWNGWLPSERYSVVPDTGGAHDVLRIATRIECGACSYASSGLHPPARLEVSVDQKGLAVHGLVSAGDLAAPICPRKHYRNPEAPDPDAAAALVAARTPGDIHRVLGLIERGGPGLAFLAEALLSDPDPVVRARAAILASRDPALAPAAIPLLRDPDPRVRSAAILAARRAPGWEERLLPLRSDPHPTVARRARLELVHSSDPRIAGPVLLHLLREKEHLARHIPYCGLAVPELAEAIVTAMEEGETSARWELGPGLAVAFDEVDLRPHVPRLVAIHDADVRAGELTNGLTECLAWADDPRADAALLRVIEAAGPDERTSCSSILERFTRRWTPVRAPRAEEILTGLLEEGGPCGEDFHCRREAALVLLASGAPRGLEWLLAEDEPSLAAAARTIGERLWEKSADCMARTVFLPIADGVHDAWRREEERF